MHELRMQNIRYVRIGPILNTEGSLQMLDKNDGFRGELDFWDYF